MLFPGPSSPRVRKTVLRVSGWVGGVISHFGEGWIDELTSVHDGERAHERGLRQMGVQPGHDVAHDGLQRHAQDQGVPRAQPVADEGAEDGPGEVEQVDDGVPAEDGGQRGAVAVDIGQDGTRVDSEGVGGELMSCASEKPGGPSECLSRRARDSQEGREKARQSYIVDEPYQADDEQSPPVEPPHERVRRPRILHGMLAELLGLLEPET